MKKSDCYYGIYPLRFVYHGEWADPEIVYKGHTFNYWNVENFLWEICKEEDPDAFFEDWVHTNKKRIKEYLNELIELSKFDE